jgi:hypothetical protein
MTEQQKTTTWRLLVPMLVYTAHNAAKPEERQGAMDELLKLADIVDTHIANLEHLTGDHDAPHDPVEASGIIPSARAASLTQAAQEIGAEPATPQRDAAREALRAAGEQMAGMDKKWEE